MKFFGLILMGLLMFQFQPANAQANESLICTNSAASLDPADYFEISYSNVGSVVDFENRKFEITSSETGYAGDFMPSQLIRLQSLEGPNSEVDIVCPDMLQK